jgi:hypothetical protein
MHVYNINGTKTVSQIPVQALQAFLPRFQVFPVFGTHKIHLKSCCTNSCKFDWRIIRVGRGKFEETSRSIMPYFFLIFVFRSEEFVHTHTLFICQYICFYPLYYGLVCSNEHNILSTFHCFNFFLISILKTGFYFIFIYRFIFE